MLNTNLFLGCIKLVEYFAFAINAVSYNTCVGPSQKIKISLFSLSIPSWQILVPRTSRERPPPSSPGRPLKILFDRPGDVPI